MQLLHNVQANFKQGKCLNSIFLVFNFWLKFNFEANERINEMTIIVIAGVCGSGK
jgi:hypothetical protein